MATGERVDPNTVFNFLITIDGVGEISAVECSGLDSETDVIEHRTGDMEPTVTKLPGMRKFPNIVVKRGFTKDRALWEWRKTVMDGRTERRSGSVVLLNEAREPTLRWNFVEAFLSKWQGPGFNAKTNDVAIETVEIAHEGIELE
jgi:phage tail-like protein